MMFKKLTAVTPKIGSQGNLLPAFPKTLVLGCLSVSLIQCAQPERQAQNGKARNPGTPTAPQEKPDNPSGSGRGGPRSEQAPPKELSDHNEKQKTKQGSYSELDQADTKIRDAAKSIVNIELALEDNRKTKVNGFIFKDKEVATALGSILPSISKELEKIDIAKESVENIKKKVLEIELSESIIQIKDSQDQILNTNRKLKFSDGTAFRIAQSLKAKKLHLDSEGALLIFDGEDKLSPVLGTSSDPSTDNGAASASFCLTSAEAKASGRKVSIAGFHDADPKIKLSEGVLVDLRSAARSVGLLDALGSSTTLDCDVIAAAAESSNMSAGSLIFEGNKAVGMVVRQAGDGEKKRTFGISFKHIN